jgi:hypothetical protein
MRVLTDEILRVRVLAEEPGRRLPSFELGLIKDSLLSERERVVALLLFGVEEGQHLLLEAHDVVDL